jgi:NosR/NirI family transcriptional regulator, nitrous oxide reductase regulator
MILRPAAFPRAGAAVPVGLAGALATGYAGAQLDAGEDLWEFDDDDDPGWLELFSDQALDIGLFSAFAVLAMISFFRKSRALKYVTLVVAVLFLGVYKSLLLSVRNIFSTLSASLPVFDHNLGWYAFAGFAVVTTVLWGRIYCGRICAFGALTQLIDAIVPARLRVRIPATLERRASYIKYGILFGAVGYYLATRDAGFYRYIEPFWMFSFEASTLLWIGLGLLLLASVFVSNLYCRFLCPLGAALGLLSTLTVFRIKRWSECSTCQLCEKTCEWGAIRQRKIIMAECVRCDDCERLYADQARCPHWFLQAKRNRRAAVEAPAARSATAARSRPPG